MLVHEFLETSARLYPNKTSVVFSREKITYRELNERANQFAHFLHARGIGKGDRVALLLHNRIEAVVGLFGVLKAGGIFLIINPTTKGDKLAYILNNSSARGILIEPEQAHLVRTVMNTVPSLQSVMCCKPSSQVKSPVGDGFSPWEDILQYPTESLNVPVEATDLACLIYTSGSTGEPKGVVEGHDNIDFVTTSIITYLKNTEKDIVLDALPLSFDYGLYQVLMICKFGGTLILERDFTFPVAVLKDMEREGVTGFPGVPTMFSILLKMDLSLYNLKALRYITNTAANLPVSYIRALMEKFPNVEIFSMYGLTECKRALYMPPHLLPLHLDSVGVAIPGTEVWLEDDCGNRIPPGEYGELVVRGPHVMRGYWEDPILTAERYRAGQTPEERILYTGDLFRVDDDGFYYFVARKDDIIKTCGEKVAPKEIENCVYQLPGIREVTVVGVPHPLLGEAIHVYVITDNPNMRDIDILEHCRKKLENFMVPHVITFCRELPHTPSGKVIKPRLQNQ